MLCFAIDAAAYPAAVTTGEPAAVRSRSPRLRCIPPGPETHAASPDVGTLDTKVRSRTGTSAANLSGAATGPSRTLLEVAVLQRAHPDSSECPLTCAFTLIGCMKTPICPPGVGACRVPHVSASRPRGTRPGASSEVPFCLALPFALHLPRAKTTSDLGMPAAAARLKRPTLKPSVSTRSPTNHAGHTRGLIQLAAPGRVS